MKNKSKMVIGLAMVFSCFIFLPANSQVKAYGYYTVDEKCPESEGYQQRCRPDGPNWCQVSQQTSCPEFEGFG